MVSVIPFSLRRQLDGPTTGAVVVDPQEYLLQS